MNYNVPNNASTTLSVNDALRALTDYSLTCVINTVEIAELLGKTDEQFYLDWEDKLNELSVKDHSLRPN